MKIHQREVGIGHGEPFDIGGITGLAPFDPVGQRRKRMPHRQSDHLVVVRKQDPQLWTGGVVLRTVWCMRHGVGKHTARVGVRTRGDAGVSP